jgi:DNA-directed RNA polymerase subunit beta'
VDLHAKVKVRIHESTVDDDGNRTRRTFLADTTPGRCMLWNIVPKAAVCSWSTSR